MVDAHAITGYYGNYYGMLFIPVGILLYLAIKYSSDFNALNKWVIINSAECRYPAHRISRDSLSSALDKTQNVNDSEFIIKHMPIRLSELRFSSLRADNSTALSPNHLNYLTALVDAYGLAKTHGDMLYIGHEKSASTAFAAREAYDEFIKYGLFDINKTDSISGFVSRNCIVASKDINSKCLCDKDMPLANVINFNGFQCRIFERRKSLFAKYNSLLLLSTVCGHVKVVNC